MAPAPRQATERQTAATPRPAERKHTVIEAKPQSNTGRGENAGRIEAGPAEAC